MQREQKTVVEEKATGKVNEEQEKIIATQEVEENLSKADFEAVVKKLLSKSDNVLYRNVKVLNVTVTQKENHTMVGITIQPPIDGMVFDERNGWIKGKTNNVYTSSYAIAGLFKQSEKTGVFANGLVDKPGLINALLNNGTIDIIQEPVYEGSMYKNPFSKKGEERMIEHDTFITHLIGVEFGYYGKKIADEYANRVAAQFFEL